MSAARFERERRLLRWEGAPTAPRAGLAEVPR